MAYFVSGSWTSTLSNQNGELYEGFSKCGCQVETCLHTIAATRRLAQLGSARFSQWIVGKNQCQRTNHILVKSNRATPLYALHHDEPLSPLLLQSYRLYPLLLQSLAFQIDLGRNAQRAAKTGSTSNVNLWLLRGPVMGYDSSCSLAHWVGLSFKSIRQLFNCWYWDIS